MSDRISVKDLDKMIFTQKNINNKLNYTLYKQDGQVKSKDRLEIDSTASCLVHQLHRMLLISYN